MGDKCGCGKPSKYVKYVDGKEVYACNKYGRCPTYEELLKELEETKKEYEEFRKLVIKQYKIQEEVTALNTQIRRLMESGKE